MSLAGTLNGLETVAQAFTQLASVMSSSRAVTYLNVKHLQNSESLLSDTVFGMNIASV